MSHQHTDLPILNGSQLRSYMQENGLGEDFLCACTGLPQEKAKKIIEGKLWSNTIQPQHLSKINFQASTLKRRSLAKPTDPVASTQTTDAIETDRARPSTPATDPACVDGSSTDPASEKPASTGPAESKPKTNANPQAIQSKVPCRTLPTGFALIDEQQGQASNKKPGVYYKARVSDDGQPVWAWLCDPLFIDAVTHDDEHRGHGRLLRFKSRHGHWQDWAMPDAMLEDDKEIRRTLRDMGLQMSVTSRPAKDALHTYLEHSTAAEEAISVTRCGWYDTLVFVLPNDTIGKLPAGKRVFLQTGARNTKGYQQQGDTDAWKRDVGALCVNNTRLILSACCAFAAPLFEPLGQPTEIFHLYGSSSIGKSTALRVGASVYGPPAARINTWRTTSNALESIAALHNNQLLCLDEIGESDKAIGEAIYMLSDGQGKGRMQRDATLRAKLRWNLLVLSTGEKTLEQHLQDLGQRITAGQDIRMLSIPAEVAPGTAFEELHHNTSGAAFVEALRQGSETSYGAPGRAFLETLVDDRDSLIATLRQRCQDFRAQVCPPDAGGQVRRALEAFAIVAEAGELATERGLTGWATGDARRAIGICFEAWLNHRGGLTSKEETQIVEQVRLFYEQHGDARFVPWSEPCNTCSGSGKFPSNTRCNSCNGTGKSNSPRSVHHRAGFRKEVPGQPPEYFTFAETFKQDVCKGFDPGKVCQILHRHGWLKRHANRSFHRKETLPTHEEFDVYRITIKD